MLVVDDQPIVRRGITTVLGIDKALEVVADVGSCRECLDTVDDAAPDVALVDIHLKDGSGFELTRELKLRDPLLKVVIVSAQDDQTCAGWSLQCGADGYVSKDAEPATLRQAVLRAWRGELAFSASAHDQVMRTTRGDHAHGIERLSAREFEVFFQLGWGRNTKEIAETLKVSPRTIETYRQNIRGKLDLPHHDALIRLATMVFSSAENARHVRDDRTLLSRFEDRSLPQPEWTHRAHVRVAFQYLARRPFGVALRAIRNGINRLNAAHGNPGGYHETITVAFARVIRSRLEREPLWLHSTGFLERHRDLVGPEALAPLDPYYSRARLMSAEARAGFVEPDRDPLPTVTERG